MNLIIGKYNAMHDINKQIKFKMYSKPKSFIS